MFLFQNQKRISWIAALGAVLGMATAPFFLPGGDDLYRYYQPFSLGCLKCGFVPYFAQWLLWPLSWVKYPLTWPIWSIICLIVFVVLVKYTEVNPFVFFISFPILGQIWLGQIDIFVCIGLVLLLLSKNPFLRGLGITLALVKPQLTFLSIFFLFFYEKRQDIWKILIIPFTVFLISLFVYGFSWPIEWIKNAFAALPPHVWRLASSFSWHYGLVLLPIPLLFRDRRTRLLTSLLAAAVATPFFGVYSYIVFLLFEINWWSAILSFIWMAAYPFFQANSMYFAFILPLALLYVISLKELIGRLLERKKETPTAYA
jgi:hypothetical protein